MSSNDRMLGRGTSGDDPKPKTPRCPSEYLDIVGQNIDAILRSIGPTDDDRIKNFSACSSLLDIAKPTITDPGEQAWSTEAMFRALVAQDPFTRVLLARLMHIGHSLVVSTWLKQGGQKYADGIRSEAAQS